MWEYTLLSFQKNTFLSNNFELIIAPVTYLLNRSLESMASLSVSHTAALAQNICFELLFDFGNISCVIHTFKENTNRDEERGFTEVRKWHLCLRSRFAVHLNKIISQYPSQEQGSTAAKGVTNKVCRH